MNGIEINNVAIITGDADFFDGAAVLAALRSGVVAFVEGDEADESESSIDESRHARRLIAARRRNELERSTIRGNNAR